VTRSIACSKSPLSETLKFFMTLTTHFGVYRIGDV
jgi:hypothetical protein